MREIAQQLQAWRAAGRGFAVATVVAVSGSAPRPPGAAMAVSTDGQTVGSVSGGCVEAAVYELCLEALRSGQPVLQRFGYSDEDAFAAALTCGGIIDIFVRPVPPGPEPGLDAALDSISGDEPVALLRVIEGPAVLPGAALAVHPDRHVGTLSDGADLEHAAVTQARALLEAGKTATFQLAPDGRSCDPHTQQTVTFFVESHVPAPRMLIFGAVDFAGAVSRLGGFLGYRVTICDAREVFATEARFPYADEVVVGWPHLYLDRESAAGTLDGRTVICVLTHDPKFDIPLLERALRMPLGYIGAMGSRRTHHDRLGRLREAGLTESEIGGLHSPIGLDLGARTPEETAVAIAAEIVARNRGGGCLPLTGGDGPIHRARHVPAVAEVP
ncbi:XdhC family protein [Streptomyces sp. ISL-1]|uniref:XdhC family protein n=1 Tax=Streptomyces sp. ISL-1 TaxID=2817657 RepID=UPI001BEB1768|nr:XdhC/CoxI family protein [Streptomyces sp. ISL-1]MBT2392241.1 XdhC family protein [Streptomyces sp. ISL-1]